MNTPRRAFSLTELLVVIAVIGVLAYVGLSAFPSMLRASDRTLANNQLRLALGAARDAAIRGDGTDAAAVFTYDPATRRMSIVPCVKVGTFKDRDPDPARATFPQNSIDRELFVPLANVSSPQLPSGWLIAGLAEKSMLDANPDNPTGWYITSAERPVTDTTKNNAYGAWVLPETDYYNPKTDPSRLANDIPYHRCSFMVRFAARTGVVMTGEAAPAAVLIPRPTALGRLNTPGERALRPDLSDNLVQWSKRLLSRSTTLVNGVDGAGAVSVQDVAEVLGAARLDSVLAASVTSLAIMNADELAKGMGIRANSRETGTPYEISPEGDPRPKWDTNAFGSQSRTLASDNMFKWVMGTLTTPATQGKAVTSDVQIFVVQASTGLPEPMTE